MRRRHQRPLAHHACFNSRTPGGVRLTIYSIILSTIRFQFTHPGRGATVDGYIDDLLIVVSIHAPREGCDFSSTRIVARSMSFNSRTPGGVRQAKEESESASALFQFTHPGRGATADAVREDTPYIGFNSRTPGGVRRKSIRRSRNTSKSFNSRTPGGVRLKASTHHSKIPLFQFTHPGRGATVEVRETGNDAHVSIHAPREGCD